MRGKKPIRLIYYIYIYIYIGLHARRTIILCQSLVGVAKSESVCTILLVVGVFVVLIVLLLLSQLYTQGR